MQSNFPETKSTTQQQVFLVPFMDEAGSIFFKKISPIKSVNHSQNNNIPSSDMTTLTDPESSRSLKKIKQLLKKGKYKDAVSVLCKQIMDLGKKSIGLPHYQLFISFFTSDSVMKQAWASAVLASGLSDTANYDNKFLIFICKQHSPEAPAIFDQMPLSNKDTNSYNTMINYYLDIGETDKAIQTREQMQKHNFKANTFTLNVLLKLCVRSKDLMQGEKILTQLRHVPKDMCTHNTLINLYCKTGYIDTAYDYLHTMKVIDRYSVPAIVNGYLNEGNILRALQTYQYAIQKQAEQQIYLVDRHTYYAIVSTFHQQIGLYSKKGAYLKAIDIYEKMADFRIPMTEDTYNFVILCCIQSSKLGKALRLYKNMQKKGFPSRKNIDHALYKAYKQHHYKLGSKTKKFIDEQMAIIFQRMTQSSHIIQAISQQQ